MGGYLTPPPPQKKKKICSPCKNILAKCVEKTPGFPSLVSHAIKKNEIWSPNIFLWLFEMWLSRLACSLIFYLFLAVHFKKCANKALIISRNN